MTSAETSAERAKRAFDEAMKNREARVAILVSDNISNALDLLDEQPAAVIEVMIKHFMQKRQSGNVPKNRHEMLGTLIEYLEQCLHEARARERRLAQAVTGADLPND